MAVRGAAEHAPRCLVRHVRSLPTSGALLLSLTESIGLCPWCTHLALPLHCRAPRSPAGILQSQASAKAAGAARLDPEVQERQLRLAPLQAPCRATPGQPCSAQGGSGAAPARSVRGQRSLPRTSPLPVSWQSQMKSCRRRR